MVTSANTGNTREEGNAGDVSCHGIDFNNIAQDALGNTV